MQYVTLLCPSCRCPDCDRCGCYHCYSSQIHHRLVTTCLPHHHRTLSPPQRKGPQDTDIMKNTARTAPPLQTHHLHVPMVIGTQSLQEQTQGIDAKKTLVWTKGPVCRRNVANYNWTHDTLPSKATGAHLIQRTCAPKREKT